MFRSVANAKRITGLVAFFLLFLTACDGKTPTVAPLGDQATVLAFGDSLTFGTGAETGASYPARLEALIGRRVVNAGVPGEFSGQGMSRLPTLLDRHRPDLLVLCHGGNDLLRRTGEEKTAANIRAMVEMARERGIDVVLIGVPRPGLVLEAPAFYEEIAEELLAPYEGEILSTILAERSLKNDRFHPNAEGYRKLAQAIAALLKKARAL
jgi:lysophospholipase L1-like esterase